MAAELEVEVEINMSLPTISPRHRPVERGGGGAASSESSSRKRLDRRGAEPPHNVTAVAASAVE
jgi:hypothetical protein